MNPPPVRVEVEAKELRRRFNQGRYWERQQAGELRILLLREREAGWQSGQPDGTRTQIIAYLDARGHRVAVVHQYLRLDGSLGGGGRPDPKMLFEEGVLYVLKAK